ncbi:MAG: hypothetical protein VKM98_06650, partial [Cyanobacteriota bacterium]|nr:hypothetical protein [Cyanobacteriota bacterium]
YIEFYRDFLNRSFNHYSHIDQQESYDHSPVTRLAFIVYNFLLNSQKENGFSQISAVLNFPWDTDLQSMQDILKLYDNSLFEIERQRLTVAKGKEAMHTLERVYASKSWKLTAPLRSAHAIVKRLRGTDR